MEVVDLSTEFIEKIKSLEENELVNQDDTHEDIYKQLIIYYLLENEPMKAKFLWKRIPSHLKQQGQSELNQLWTFSEFLIKRQYSEAFGLINKHQNANKIQFLSNTDLNSLITLLVEKTKERILDLINVAYSSISLNDISSLFSITTDEVLKLALAREWTQDDSKQFLITRRKQDKEISNIHNKIQMQQLTNLVSYLDTI